MTLPLQQSWPLPTSPRPIVFIGGGDIVRDAHIPAYQAAGYPIAGVFDLDENRANARVAEAGGDARVFSSMDEVATLTDVIFDCATPPGAHANILQALPDHAAVMLQKPMGQSYAAAKEIVRICEAKNMTAAVNFQLRFSPYMLAIRDFLQKGCMGQIVDIDFHINVHTPWEIFPFLANEERTEFLVHSIHYFDLIRSFVGNPKGVYARTVKHPKYDKLASSSSSIILDYGDELRVCLSINHDFTFKGDREDAWVRFQGTEGAAFARLGVLMDYPNGRPPALEVIGKGIEEWTTIPLQGGWFPDSFMGSMGQLQRFVIGDDDHLTSSVQDALHTMAVVEACYTSSEQGATPLPE